MQGRPPRSHDKCGDRCTTPGPDARARFRPDWTRPLRHAPGLVQDTAAVSPVIATVLILAISAIGIGAVLSWGLPSVQQTQATTEIEGVLDQFFAFDQVAESVLHGGAVGKASQASISFPTGEVQRIVDHRFVITWYPNMTGGNPTRFDIRGLDDSDPNSIELHALGGAATQTFVAQLNRTDNNDIDPVYSIPFSGNPSVAFPDISENGQHAAHVPTSIRVTADGQEIMQTWILPAGALQYTRNAPFGVVGIRLENSCVITQYETGPFIHNKPLSIVDRNSLGEPIFAAFFQQILVDNATFPGVQAAGAGSFPVLFALQQNHLRAPGDPVVAAHINVTGSLSTLWKQYYADTYGYEWTDPLSKATSDLHLDAPAGRSFDFVLMENRIEVTMKPSTLHLGRAAAGQ